MSYNTTEEVHMNEGILGALVASQGKTSAVATAFHNIFVHGEIFEHGVEEEQLERLFVHLDGVLATIDVIER